MIYSTEEKQKMDALVKAFGGYIAESREFDIAYTDKTGYIWILIAEHADTVYFPIAGYDEMLRRFFEEFLYVESELSSETGAQERLCGILNTLDGDRQYALDAMKAYWKTEQEARG